MTLELTQDNSISKPAKKKQHSSGKAVKRIKRDREISGILLLNKPRGITSNSALQRARSIFLAKKGGHTGNLDPLAEGVLPICFGEATKFSQFLLNSDKSYRVKVKLGITTDTGDAEGKIISETEVPEINFTQVERILQKFIGKITQIPPMYSALKHKGKPLYEYARSGIEIERQSRDVTIHDIKLLACMEHDLIIEVNCSKGTYIRTLAEDIGNELGCGAHVTDLLRLSVGPFMLKDAITLEELSNIKNSNNQSSLGTAPDNKNSILENALEHNYSGKSILELNSLEQNNSDQSATSANASELSTTVEHGLALEQINLEEQRGINSDFSKLDQTLLPISELLYHLPKVELCDISSLYISQGNPVFVPKLAFQPNEQVAVFMKKSGNLLGVATVRDDGKLAPKRLVKMG